MRRNLAIASVVGFVVAGFALGLLLFIGGPVASPIVFSSSLAVGILGFVAGVLCGVFGIVLPLFGRGPLNPDEYTSVVAAGREGLARVLSARPTGARLNGSDVYDVELIVDQTRVPAYRTRDRIRVDRQDGVLRGGEIISVVRPRDDAPQVVVVAGPARTAQDALVPQDAPPWR
ncbi:hypothetical protein BH09ACT4_BH09ACT4_14290 [soil metagenome]